MLLRFKDTGDNILFNASFSMHSKVWANIKTYSYRIVYNAEGYEPQTKKWSMQYVINRGIDSKVFRMPYINNYKETNKRYTYRIPYGIDIPRTTRYLFKAPYTVSYPLPVEMFKIFSMPYNIEIGARKRTYTFKTPYENATNLVTPARKTFKMRYSHARSMDYKLEWSMPYINEQVKNPNISIKFGIPYINTVSTTAMSYLVDGVDVDGNAVKIRESLKPYVETSGGNPVVVIPMFVAPLLKDTKGEIRDIKSFITYPPKYINYALTDINAHDKDFYERLGKEHKVGNGITTLLISNPENTDRYKAFNSPILEYRIYGIRSTISIATDYDKERFLKSITGISIATYIKGGKSKTVYLENGDLYVDSDIHDFDNVFANLHFRARDSRDDTINLGFDKKVTADSQLYRIKIKEVNNCCLDKAIDIGRELTTCKLPKASININITTSSSEEVLKFRPLSGFLRKMADGYSITNPIDPLGLAWDQPERDGTLMERIIVKQDDPALSTINSISPSSAVAAVSAINIIETPPNKPSVIPKLD